MLEKPQPFGIPYEKLRIAVRYWMLGRNYHVALRAMEFGQDWHRGRRRDDNPEFSHQVWQASYIRTLEAHLLHPEETLAAAFLHDVVEDYPVSLPEIELAFGERVAHAVDRLSKKVSGKKKDPQAYFRDLAQDPIASVVKGCDRIHNHQSMVGVFDAAKQKSYLDETQADILPMLKLARRRFTQQEPAYENIRHLLMAQMQLYWQMLGAVSEVTPNAGGPS
ncbi:MAG: HD domain-containing protein [Rhodobacteraceae bacterium]|nr:HD domain-containing protein [Paracoccaceae bacterium]